jgi:bacterioferritin
MYEKSIELLNKAVADEMSAVHQYMYFHFTAKTRAMNCSPVFS